MVKKDVGRKRKKNRKLGVDFYIGRKNKKRICAAVEKRKGYRKAHKRLRKSIAEKRKKLKIRGGAVGVGVKSYWGKKRRKSIKKRH
jgi:isocitrate dehydrogenase